MNNKAVIEFGFRRICRLYVGYPPRPSASVDNTLLDLQNSSYPTQPQSIIANYPCFILRNILGGRVRPIRPVVPPRRGRYLI